HLASTSHAKTAESAPASAKPPANEISVFAVTPEDEQKDAKTYEIKIEPVLPSDTLQQTFEVGSTIEDIPSWPPEPVKPAPVAATTVAPPPPPPAPVAAKTVSPQPPPPAPVQSASGPGSVKESLVKESPVPPPPVVSLPEPAVLA